MQFLLLRYIWPVFRLRSRATLAVIPLHGLAERVHARQVLAAEVVDEEEINTPVCPLQDKFHTFVLRGLRNISEDP